VMKPRVPPVTEIVPTQRTISPIIFIDVQLTDGRIMLSDFVSKRSESIESIKSIEFIESIESWDCLVVQSRNCVISSLIFRFGLTVCLRRNQLRRMDKLEQFFQSLQMFHHRKLFVDQDFVALIDFACFVECLWKGNKDFTKSNTKTFDWFSSASSSELNQLWNYSN
jgi:hypothetical protein